MFIQLLLLAIGVFLFYHLYYKRRGLPPGPTPLPLFGNLLEVLFDPPGERVYMKWRDQFGPVYTYWMGELPIVAVTDYETIVETFQKDAETYAGRYAFVDFMKLTRGGTHGVIFTEDNIWREQRRFALKVFRDFGMGKNLMMSRVLDEVHTVFEKADEGIESGAKEHDLYGFVDIAVGSIINAFLFGYRFHGAKEQEFADLKSRVQTHIVKQGTPMVMMTMANPYLFIKLPVFNSKFRVFLMKQPIFRSSRHCQRNRGLLVRILP
jgi:cytochrome P450 family 33